MKKKAFANCLLPLDIPFTAIWHSVYNYLGFCLFVTDFKFSRKFVLIKALSDKIFAKI